MTLLITKLIGDEKKLPKEMIEIINFYFAVNITKYFGNIFNLINVCNYNNINIPLQSFKEWSNNFWNEQKKLDFVKRNPISDIYDPHPKVEGFINDVCFPWNDNYIIMEKYIITRMRIKEKSEQEIHGCIYRFKEAWILSGRKIMINDTRINKIYENKYSKCIIKDITY